MQMLSHLWLPIIVSAAAVWIVSAMAWMALPHHKKDFQGVPNEEGFRGYLKSAGVAPGAYGFPYFANKKDCGTPEGKARWESGPVGMLTVWGKISMGRNMLLTFLVYLVISVLVGYVGAAAFDSLPVARERVFQVLGTVGVLSYAFAFIPNNIWFGASPRAIVMNIVDGIVYGLVTGAVFALLWPGH